jgi:DNA topoisomerase-3
MRTTTRGESSAPRRAATHAGGGSQLGSSRHSTVEALGCPRCGAGTLLTGARGWGCSRWREGCRFVIWFETSGRRLTLAQLRDLVMRGRTRKARFGDQTGSLVLDGDAPRFEPAGAPAADRRGSARGRGSSPPGRRTSER